MSSIDWYVVPSFYYLYVYRMTGVVKFFNTEKGFGFIVADDQSGDMFFHISQCAEDYQNPQEGDKVSYQMGEGRKGPQAEAVVLVEAAGAEDVDAFAMAA